MLVFINNFKYQTINQSARNSEFTILLTKVEIYSIIPIELVGNRKEIIMESLLDIKNLHAVAGDKEILKGLNLKINKGETHVIMGPNGAGKSTLANVILNNPEYKKTEGEVDFEGENINNLTTDKIAKKGIFMSFQLPVEIPGISTVNFLKYAKNKITDKPVKIFELKKTIEKFMEEFNMNPILLERNLNVGFSGGEKKKKEIFQMLF